MSRRDLDAITSEVEAIARRVGIRGRDLTVIDVDAEVASVSRYRRVEDLAVAHGRGGTDMRVGIAHAVDFRPRPSVVVVATDGYTPWPSEPTPLPLVVVLVGEEHRRSGPRAAIPAWVTGVVGISPAS